MTTIQHPLHSEALSLTAEERKITSLVIANLQKISNQKLHLRWGYSSLFEYCTKALGYSEACAYRRIAAMKISQELPEIKQQLEAGTINLTNLTMAQGLISKIEKAQKQSRADEVGIGQAKVTEIERAIEVDRSKAAKLSSDEKREIIKQIEGTSKQEAERRLNQIARAKGVEVFKQKDQVRMLGDEVRLEVTIARETYEKLERIKNLRSHKNTNPSFAALIDDMAEIILNKIDPLRSKVKEARSCVNRSEAQVSPSAEDRDRTNEKTRAEVVGEKKSLSLEKNHGVTKNPRYVSSQLKAKVWQRDQGRCTYTEINKRCESKHLLQIDHIRPVQFGGQATAQNLRLLCHAHHRLRADEPRTGNQ